MSRTIVIAGVGEGLGSSIARVFAQNGDDVALLARSSEYITTLAADLSESTPGRAAAFPTDLADSAEVADAFASLRERLGPVGGLVFTAFGGGGGGGVFDTDPDQLRDALDVRVHGLFECVSEATADMRDNDGGTVVVVNSGTSRTPSENTVDSTARHACRGLTRSIAADPELGSNGIQAVHAIVDGWISKPSLHERFPDHDRWMAPGDIATVLRRLVDAPDSVHTSEIDLRHPEDAPSF